MKVTQYSSIDNIALQKIKQVDIFERNVMQFGHTSSTPRRGKLHAPPRMEEHKKVHNHITYSLYPVNVTVENQKHLDKKGKHSC